MPKLATQRSVKTRLDIAELPQEQRGRYNTLAGLLMTVSGRLLGTGEKVAFNGWQFEVLDLDGRRVDKVLASRTPAAAPNVSPTTSPGSRAL